MPGVQTSSRSLREEQERHGFHRRMAGSGVSHTKTGVEDGEMAQWVKCCPVSIRNWFGFPEPTLKKRKYPGMVACTCNPGVTEAQTGRARALSTLTPVLREAEAGTSLGVQQGWGQARRDLHGNSLEGQELQASMWYTVGLSVNTQRHTQTPKVFQGVHEYFRCLPDIQVKMCKR